MYLLLTVFSVFVLCDAELGGVVNVDNEWVVRLIGGPKMAQRLAEEMDYNYQGPVCNIILQLIHPLQYNNNNNTSISNFRKTVLDVNV